MHAITSNTSRGYKNTRISVCTCKGPLKMRPMIAHAQNIFLAHAYRACFGIKWYFVLGNRLSAALADSARQCLSTGGPGSGQLIRNAVRLADTLNSAPGVTNGGQLSHEGGLIERHYAD